MTTAEWNRAQVIGQVLKGRSTQAQAAQALQLSVRQIKRLCARMRRDGPSGLEHGLRGRPSNRRLDPALLETALSALHDPLWDGLDPPTAKQKLDEHCGLTLGVEQVRRLMTQTGLWEPGERGARVAGAATKFGAVVHVVALTRSWAAADALRGCLILFMDDASDRLLYGEFAPVDDPLAVLRAARTYLKLYGRPVSVSLGGEAADDDDDRRPRDERACEQVARAMGELGVAVLEPEAAGGQPARRMRRHASQLSWELRRRALSTLEAANRFLWHTYIPQHNAFRGLPPGSPANAHRPLVPGQDLLDVLSAKLTRSLRADQTVSCFGGPVGVPSGPGLRVGCAVSVQLRLDGSVRVLSSAGKQSARLPLWLGVGAVSVNQRALAQGVSA